MAKKYDGSVYRAPGRPRTATEISGLVVRMAEENRGWGYRRIQGALSNLGQVLARTTIADILKRHGIDPAPERGRKTTWKEFLTRHWDQIVATDFFTVEVWTCSGLTRFVILFFMDVSTRRVEIGGIASLGNGLWMAQIARHPADEDDGCNERKCAKAPTTRRNAELLLPRGRMISFCVPYGTSVVERNMPISKGIRVIVKRFLRVWRKENSSRHIVDRGEFLQS